MLTLKLNQPRCWRKIHYSAGEENAWRFTQTTSRAI
jgi:hypothetical protein